MLRRNLVGIVALTLIGIVAAGTRAAGAQMKDSTRAPVKSMKAAIVDINAAPEAEIVSVGIERTVAKKIIDGRPWRNKRDLLTKQLLTKEQYEKLKDSLTAKQPKKS